MLDKFGAEPSVNPASAAADGCPLPRFEIGVVLLLKSRELGLHGADDRQMQALAESTAFAPLTALTRPPLNSGFTSRLSARASSRSASPGRRWPAPSRHPGRGLRHRPRQSAKPVQSARSPPR